MLYSLTTQNSLPSRAETEYFRRDPRLELAQSATPKMYSGSGYSRGHVTAASKTQHQCIQHNND